MNLDLDPTYAIYLLVFLAAMFLIQSIHLFTSDRIDHRRSINHRLRAASAGVSKHDVLISIRRKRGLTDEGQYVLPIIWLNRLLLQSGMRIGIWIFLLVCAALGTLSFVLVFVLRGNVLMAALAAGLVGALLPLFYLRVLRNSRRMKFAAQLPDAIDTMVRSLRAGHPVPVSLSMVAREMPDPVGSEFGLTSDELTYGMDVEAALKNMGTRVGLDDLNLLVVAVSIQTSTGGNLSEILSNLSDVIRSRFKMRRKVRALSAEGRMSAIGLSIVPVILFGIISVISPEYYGAVWDDPLIEPALILAVSMLLIGNLIMFKMVNFKF